MEQTKTDPGRKKKKPLRRCGIFFACLLFLFLCSFVYISKNPRARMLLSVIYFMQDTLKDPAYIAYHIDIMELCQDYFNGDISFEGKAYMNDIKNFNYSSSMDISGELVFCAVDEEHRFRTGEGGDVRIVEILPQPRNAIRKTAILLSSESSGKLSIGGNHPADGSTRLDSIR